MSNKNFSDLMTLPMKNKILSEKPLKIVPDNVSFFSIPYQEHRFQVYDKQLDALYSIRRDEPKPENTKLTLNYFDGQVLAIGMICLGHQENLYFHVGIDELEIGCTCGKENGLCLHGYLTLKRKSIYSVNFQDFYWPDFHVDKNGNQAYLEIKKEYGRITINPKPEFRKMFRPGFNFSGMDEIRFEQGAEIKSNFEHGKVTGYLVSITGDWSNSTMVPFIRPFIGLLNKKGAIKSFAVFPRKNDNWPISLTEEQITLNEISYDLWETSKEIFLASRDFDSTVYEDQFDGVVKLLSKALMLLKYQKFIFYADHESSVRPNKYRPQKNWISPFNAADEFKITLRLTEFKDYFFLEPVINYKERTITTFDKFPLFLRDIRSGTFFLLSRIQDERLMKWFSRFHYRLTVLKVHFDAFHETFLSGLARGYEITVVKKGRSKQVPFEYSKKF